MLKEEGGRGRCWVVGGGGTLVLSVPDGYV